jgi:cation diffusion facilitator CzcD-associated flavoprotein CzcO
LVKQLPNKKWQVIWTNYLTGDRTTEVFDYLVCSSGLHCMASLPTIKNSEKFKGEILHSVNYRSKDPKLKDKRVVVVGNSYSGAEISSHLVGHAKSIVNVFSRPYLVFPRLLKIETGEKNVYHIIPNDLFYSRMLAFTSLSREEERRNKIEIFSKLCPIQTNKKKAHPDMYYELNDDEPIREATTDNYNSFISNGKYLI